MASRSLLGSIALAGVIALPCLTAPQSANAQTLIDFLWGGGKEWGGEKQTVAFNPKYTPDQIIVSFGDRRLYHIVARGQAVSYPIAVPREQSRWQGTTKVTAKRENPSWRPTPDMLQENPKLPSWVPGGHPMNPLGVRALYLGSSLYRIHGTDAPWTIGQAVSKGCIRMFNKDVLDLYPKISVGTRVTVTWERFNTQAIADSGSSGYGQSGYQSAAFQKSGYRRSGNRQLPSTPRSAVYDAQEAAVRMEEQPAPLTEDHGIPTLIEAPVRRPKFVPEQTAKAEPESEPAAKPEKAKPDVTAEKAKSDEAAKPAAKPTKTAKVAEPKAEPKTAEPAAKPEPVAEKAPKQAEDKPAKTAKAEAKPAADAVASGASSAAEAAQKAAEAAARAARAAREAAEIARKAATSAKKATTSSKEPPKDPEKSASL